MIAIALLLLYRVKFLPALKLMIAKDEVIPPDNTDAKQLFNLLYQKDWVVFSKAPFGGPHAVIEYLGRYTHKVAISNHHIQSINGNNGTVIFCYKYYADGGTKKTMTLVAAEFIRRFQQHILPACFTKIRTYGYLANRERRQRVNEVLLQMKLSLHQQAAQIPMQLYLLEKYGIDTTECPRCKNKPLQLIHVFYQWKHAADDG
ncbi:MAG: transposase [Ferruginibacter sp.]